MSDKKKVPTSVYAEMTPNPAVMKFVVDRNLISGGEQVEFTSKAAASGYSTLADELFNFPFVTNVFISGNFVAITKDDSLSWEMILMQLRSYLTEWLMDNEVCVQKIPENPVLTSEFAKSEESTESEAFISADDIQPSELDDEIKHLLDEFVRPAVEQDGGAIDFTAFKDGNVYVKMRGACSGCPSSMQTLKGGIENLLKAKLPAVENVVAVAG